MKTHGRTVARYTRPTHLGCAMNCMSAETQHEFVDASVWVYAFDASAGVKRTKTEQLLERLCNTGIGCLSVQVLQEFFIAVTRKVPAALDRGSHRAPPQIRDLEHIRTHRARCARGCHASQRIAAHLFGCYGRSLFCGARRFWACAPERSRAPLSDSIELNLPKSVFGVAGSIGRAVGAIYGRSLGLVRELAIVPTFKQRL